jgi:large subunit ribosomal protein L21
MYAIVATGGKQVKVAVGDVVTVEKLAAPVGESVAFDVLFLSDGDSIVVDPATLASAKVTGEVVEHFKGEKAVIFKFKKRKGYKRLKGHRQELTRVRITDVVAEAAPAKKAAPRKKKTEEPVEVAVEATEAAEQD